MIWKMIMSFAGYSFCKPHSASYAQVSFKCAYLRAHYPAEFLAAVISNQGGFYSTFAYLSEARRMGLAILPPDVNASDWAYTGAGDRIRMGFMQVKTIPEELGESIVKERTERGPFRSFQDFLGRVKPEPAQARTLIAPVAAIPLQANSPDRPSSGGSTRKKASSDPFPSRTIMPLYKNSPTKPSRLDFWRAATHCAVSSAACTPAACAGLADGSLIGRHITMVGWLITEKPETKDGLPMEFATFEDKTALYDATLFPDIYRRCHHSYSNQPYVVRGLVEEELRHRDADGNRPTIPRIHIVP